MDFPAEPEGESPRPRGLFQCTECKRSYTRVDHLARHVRSHLQEKPFQCEVCHKGFGRPDLLKRHATCHDTDGNGAKRQKRTLNQSSRVSQACKSCAYAKLKCEDEKPCKRCRTKGITCESNGENHSAAASKRQQNMDRAPPTTQGRQSDDSGAIPSAPPPTQPVDTEQVINQMPTPTTLLHGFELSGDEGSVADSRLTNFTPSIPPEPGVPPQPLNLHENYFSDFLRNVLTPNNVQAFSPSNWQDLEPRNVLDFAVDDSLDFDANDFGLLDAFNGRTFNSNDAFNTVPPNNGVPPTSAVHPASTIPSTGAAPSSGSCALEAHVDISTSESTSTDPRHRLALTLGIEAYRKSSWSQWYPAQENAQREIGNISNPRTEACSPDGRYKVDQRILNENLEQTTRDKLLAMILNTCDTRNTARVVASFPTNDLLDDLLQCFFSKQGLPTHLYSYIHAPTFSPNNQRPELLGAIVAAGAIMTDIRALQKLGYALQESIRLAVANACEEANVVTRELWVLQSFMLVIELGVWSGTKRKTEIAESHQQVLWTMLRRGGRFKKSRQPPIVPLPDDTGDVLHRKWLAWVERESFRRVAFHGFIHDAQSSMSLLVNPIISYGELSLSFPESGELWAAETAEQWKTIYLSMLGARPVTPPERQQLCLLDCLKDPTLLASLSETYDLHLTSLIVLHGIWGMIWEFHQLQMTMRVRAGTYNSSLVMTHRRDELCQTLHHLRISMSEWRTKPCPETIMLLDLQLMYLHMSMVDIQLFAGKEDADEARRVFPSLQQWIENSHSRQAVWQAGQILKAAKVFKRKQLRNFYVIAVYHAALALWTYGVIKQATSPSNQEPASTHGANSNKKSPANLFSNATVDPALYSVWLEGPETPDVQRFIALGRGAPSICPPSAMINYSTDSGSASASTPPLGQLAPLSNPEAVMNAVLETLRQNCSSELSDDEGQGLPPLVENLMTLIRDLGVAARAVSSH